MRNKTPVAALVAAVIAAVIAIIAAVLAIGEAINPTRAVTRGESASITISLYVLLFGAAIMLAVFAAFLFIGIDDWQHRRSISDLYWPQLCVKGTMFGYMLLLSVNVVDLIVHGLHPRWPILYTPLARIFQSALLFTVFVCFGWVLVVVLRGRMRDHRREHAATGRAASRAQQQTGAKGGGA